MARFNWVLTLFLGAILGATFLLASCEGDDPPESTDDESTSSACKGKTDNPRGCSFVHSDEDASVSSTDTTEGSQPDTEEPPPLPKCSESDLPYPTGTLLDCGPLVGQCQLEWHDNEQKGCVASCVPGGFEDRPLVAFILLMDSQCPPANP